MSETTYNDSDFVYVDPETKTVIGIVEWDKNGNAVPKEKVFVQKEESGNTDKGDGKGKRKPRKRSKSYYPWGSYQTMNKLYKLDKKPPEKDTDRYITLNTAIDKLMDSPFWD